MINSSFARRFPFRLLVVLALTCGGQTVPFTNVVTGSTTAIITPSITSLDTNQMNYAAGTSLAISQVDNNNQIFLPMIGKVSLFMYDPPSIPILVTPPNNTLVTDLTPTLMWMPSTVPPIPPGAAPFDHYRVLVWIVSGASAIVRVDKQVQGIDNTSYNIIPGDLEHSTTYYWGVLAYNTFGQHSNFPPTWSFRTP